MLEAEHLAGPAEAGLDFVGDEKRAVFPAKLLGPIIKVGLRRFAALALHRLDHERRHIALGQLVFERGDVIQRDARFPPSISGPKPSVKLSQPMSDSEPRLKP